MKKLILIIPIIFFCIKVQAQGFELSVQANSGLSHYTGPRAAHSTNLNANATSHDGYANADGNILAPDFGAGLKLQYTFKFNFLIGTNLDYEVLSDKVDINYVYDGTPNGITATGYSNEHNCYFDLSPYLGYRFNLNKVRLDVMPGVDIALGTNSFTTINVKTADGGYYNKPSPDYSTAPATELRYRLGLAAWYKRFGITASWSRGKDIRNYLADGPVPPEDIQLYRLGVAYRIR